MTKHFNFLKHLCKNASACFFLFFNLDDNFVRSAFSYKVLKIINFKRLSEIGFVIKIKKIEILFNNGLNVISLFNRYKTFQTFQPLRKMSYAKQTRPSVVGQADIYIPRMNRDRASFPFISSVFVENAIGYVEHIDFVEINANHHSATENSDKEPLPFVKHPTLVSAFIKVVFWDKKTLDAIRNPPNLRKLYLFSDSEEHWLLLPNKNPIDRTILNIHQVAHYTAEVQTNIASMSKVVDDVILQNKALIESVEALIKQNKIIQSEIDKLKTERNPETKTVISIVHNARDNVARKLISDCLCGNA